MFDFVPEIGAKREFECRWDMPADQRYRGSEPANSWARDESSHLLHRHAAKDWTDDQTHKPLR